MMGTRAVNYILIANVLNAGVGALFFFSYQFDPTASPFLGIFLRILMNFFVLRWAFRDPPDLKLLRNWKNQRGLWAWGLCGVVASTSYFYAIFLSGAGITNFLNSSSTFCMALFTPVLLKQKIARQDWLATIAGLVGLSLLLLPKDSPISFWGSLLALLSGLVTGFAYLFLSRSGKRSSPTQIMLFWTVPNFLFYFAVLSIFRPSLPERGVVLLFLILAGILAAMAQWLTVQAYQMEKPVLIGCLSYLSPVFSVLLDILIFKIQFSFAQILGAAIVVCFGCLYPLWKSQLKTAPLPVDI